MPPLCIFPEQKDLGTDYRQNLITVPACDTHNLRKSKDDEYLLLVLVHGYFNNPIGRAQFSTKVIRAMVRRLSLAYKLYEKSRPVTVNGEETISVEIELERFEYAIGQICRGLYYHHFGNRWKHDISVITANLVAMGNPAEDADLVNSNTIESVKRLRSLSDSAEAHGANSDVFWYQIIDDHLPSIAWRLVFYGGFEVYGLSGRPKGGV